MSGSPNSFRILVADDDSMIRDLLRDALEAERYWVLTAVARATRRVAP